MVITSGRDRLLENTLGLIGEAGEVSEKVKKNVRGDGPLDNQAVAKELGDVLFYLVALAAHLGYTLEDIIGINVEKLEGRQKRGTLQGEGDNR